MQHHRYNFATSPVQLCNISGTTLQHYRLNFATSPVQLCNFTGTTLLSCSFSDFLLRICMRNANISGFFIRNLKHFFSSQLHFNLWSYHRKHLRFPSYAQQSAACSCIFRVNQSRCRFRDFHSVSSGSGEGS